jgi:hypothetical protein
MLPLLLILSACYILIDLVISSKAYEYFLVLIASITKHI